MTDYIKPYAYGACSGSFAALLTHPALIIKIALQENKKPMYIRRELYKGVNYQMLGMAWEKMLVFGIYNHTVSSFNLDPHTNLSHSALAGFTCGSAASIMTTLADQCTISKKNMNVKKLWQGFKWTYARESIGFAIYFSIYEYLSNVFNCDKHLYKTALIGATTSIGAWTIIYPIDTIKTHVQAQAELNLKKNYNMKLLYKGFHFSLIRAVPFHTTCFVMYETLKNIFD